MVVAINNENTGCWEPRRENDCSALTLYRELYLAAYLLAVTLGGLLQVSIR